MVKVIAALWLLLALLLEASVATAMRPDIGADLMRLKTQFLPAEYAKTNFTLDDAKRLLREKCMKAAGEDHPSVYENIEQAAMQLVACINDVANVTEMLAEVEEARPIGELDVVFQKYCQKRPTAEQCLREFNEHLIPCLTLQEKAQNLVMMRIITSLLEFICYKNGDQIALFIAEEGPECIEANKENIGNCMNATFYAYMPKEGLNTMQPLAELPELVVGPKQCIDLYDFEECVLGYLEQCNEITPANIIESMFKYVKNETKCQPEIDKAIQSKRIEPRNRGAHLQPALVVTLAGAVAVAVAVAVASLRTVAHTRHLL